MQDGIAPNMQTVGIQTASTYWYHKVAEQPKGDDRQRFVNWLGKKFRSWLIDDTLMSYPGRNGFSLVIEEFSSCKWLKDFLEEAVDYGDLVDAPHTTKAKDRRQRRKWYLNPVLSAYYQIPDTHVKEPYYATVDEVMSWCDEAEIVPDDVRLPGKKQSKTQNGQQPTLFDKHSDQGHV